MGPAPTAPLTDHESQHARGQCECPCLWEYLDQREQMEAIARHREQADAEVARLKAAIPEDPWVWLSRRQPGHARCYACDASWSLSQGHEPDCRWVSARSVK